MLKTIKVLGDYSFGDGTNIKEKELPALITEDEILITASVCDPRSAYPYQLYNYKVQDANNPAPDAFNIVGPVRSDRGTKAQRELNGVKKEMLEQSEKLQTAYEQLSDLQDDNVKLVDENKKLKDAPVNRALIQEGYVIVPCAMLDDELARDVGSEPEIIINAKELIAMRASAVMEINKGDTRETSL